MVGVKMKVRSIASLVMGLCFAAGSANASSIGVFTAPDGSDCDAEVVPFTPFFTYVIALLGGDAAAGGISGAELRLLGIDAGWSNTVTPNPAAFIVLGNVIGDGANIAFPALQPGPMVTLFTIQSLALAPVTPRTLGIVKKNPQASPAFDCPLVTLAPPDFYSLCVLGGEAFLNRALNPPCTVGVTPTTWTQMKNLYGN